MGQRGCVAALVLWCAVIIIFPGKKRVAKFLDARHEYKTR